jgi:oligopeptide transport system substrate-binding protein
MRQSIQIFALLTVIIAFAGCAKRETPAEEGVKTQTLLLGNAAEPQDLDPHSIYAWTDSNIAYSLFEPLTWIDEKTTQPVPAAAERWESTPDGLTWTFHLRAGLRWSNGDPVTARDWVYSLHRILSPNLAASYSYMIWPVKNAQAFNAGKIKDFEQVGVKAPDERTLVLNLERPTPYLPALVSHTTWLPVEQATIERFGKMDQKGSRWTRPGNLVGNGPFVLTEWSPNSRITVVKNPHYWDAAKVRLNKIVFFPIEDGISEERDFRAGQLHATYGLPVNKIEPYRKDHPDQLRIELQLASYYLFINTTKKPFDDWRVRRALAMTVDRPQISAQVTKGSRSPAYTYTPPDCAGYTCKSPMPDDYDGARKLLADAGYPRGQGLPKVEVLSYSSEISIKTLEVVQAVWARELGFHIQIAPVEQKTLFSRSQTGDYNLAFSAWIADYPDPSTFLNCLQTGNGNNWAKYSNPEYDRLLDAAANVLDNQVRYEDFQKAEAILMHDAPLVPLYFGQRPYLVHPALHGWPESKLGFKAFKNVWLGR